MKKGSGWISLAALACMTLTACTDSPVSRAQGLESKLNAPAPSIAQSETASKQFSIYLTGYTYWDNTPPGSAAIARPVLRQRAGGTGTWQSPITIAVGHSIVNGRQKLDYPAGTRFYLPRLRKYAIVEDVCGDGPTPQGGPCHSGHKGHPWLDIWIGGKSVSFEASDACARRITAVQSAIINPPSDLPVQKGEIATGGCQVFL
jgi:hypothetical protein